MRIPSLKSIKDYYHQLTWGWIVDRDWYLDRYKDVAQNGIDPVRHYIIYGCNEGRWPNPFFDPVWIAENSDGLASPTEAFRYFRHHGGRVSPHPLYLDLWYQKECDLPSEVARYKDLILRGRFESISSHPLIDINSLPEHLRSLSLQELVLKLIAGLDKSLSTHPLFSPVRYLRRYPDVNSFGSHPLIHYLKKGWREGRDPHILFSTSWYLNSYSEALAPNDCPLIHYLTSNGEGEFDPCPQFSELWYRGNYDTGDSFPGLIFYLQNREQWKYAPTSWWDNSLWNLIEDKGQSSPLENFFDRVIYDQRLSVAPESWDNEGNPTFLSSDIERSSKIIAFCIPTPSYGSGGHRTIFNIISQFISEGFEVHLYCDWSRDVERKSLRKSILEMFGSNDAGITRADRFIVHEHLDIPQGFSLYVATMWNTIEKILKCNISQEKIVYLVQDYEPYFYRERDLISRAEGSYSHGIRCVTIGRWLANFVRSKYQCSVEHFDFCVDQSIYSASEPVSNAVITFIFQPLKPRRCSFLGIEALKIVKKKLPNVEIILYGSDSPVSDLVCEQKGVITPSQCGDLYRSSRVGVCFSDSNPSRVPFEMMSSGLPVIELDVESTKLDFEGSGAVKVNRDASEIAKRIIEVILDDEVYLNLRGRAIRFMAGRDLHLECREAVRLLRGNLV